MFKLFEVVCSGLCVDFFEQAGTRRYQPVPATSVHVYVSRMAGTLI